MSNILNAHIESIDNPILARKIRKDSDIRYVEAPNTLYKYSIDDELQKKDEFRKSVIQGQIKDTNKGKNSFITKACFILAALTAFFWIKCK